MKNKIEIIGFLLLVLGTSSAFISEHFYELETDPLLDITWLTAMAFFTLDWEYKKKSPRNWLIYIVVTITIIADIVLLLLYLNK